MKATIFYFSGTGNSKYVAKRFCAKMNQLGGNEFTAYSIEDDLQFERLFGNRIIGFCYPTYGSCVPRIMREFVAKHRKLLARKRLIILCTQLMYSGDGARVLTNELHGLGCKVILAEHFNMPNNICNLPIFKITNGEQNRQCIRKVKQKIASVCFALSSGVVISRGFNPVSIGLGLVQRHGFEKKEYSARSSVVVDDDCINCGLCVKTCPMKNLMSIGGKVHGKSNCTLCYRCVNLCPTMAITALINAKPKVQYKGI